MACSTSYISYNAVHTSTGHQDHLTSRDPTHLLGLLDTMDSDNSDKDKFNAQVDLQDYKHSSINVHIQDDSTDNQDISFKHSTFYSVTLPVSVTPVNNCLCPCSTRRVNKCYSNIVSGLTNSIQFNAILISLYMNYVHRWQASISYSLLDKMCR